VASRVLERALPPSPEGAREDESAMDDPADITMPIEVDAEPEPTTTPCKRLRLAVLLRALADIEAGGRLRRDALAWLLATATGGPGLRARDIFEEIGLDPDDCQRALRRRRRDLVLASLLQTIGDAALAQLDEMAA
jgi:hypothetical protein